MQQCKGIQGEKFITVRCKVLHMGQGSPDYEYKWSGEWIESNPQQKTWGCWLTRTSTWAGNVRLQPWKPIASWATLKAAWPAGQGRQFLSIYFTLVKYWSTASSSGASSIRSTWTLWSESRGGPQRWSGAAAPLMWRPRAEIVLPGEGKTSGRLREGLKDSLRGACSERTRRNCLKLTEDRLIWGNKE